MLPPPMTMATWTPRPCTSRISSAMRRTMSGSRPNWRGPIRASPESLSRILRYFASLATPATLGGPGGPIGSARRVAGALRLARLVLAEHEPGEPLDPDVLAALGDDGGNHLPDRQVRVADEGLLHQAELLVELLHLAGDDLLHHRVGLAGGARLLPVDLLFLPQHRLGHLLAVDEAGLRRGDVHRQVLHQTLEVGGARHVVGLAVHLDQDPDAPARVDVGAHRPLARGLRRAPGRGRLASLP